MLGGHIPRVQEDGSEFSRCTEIPVPASGGAAQPCPLAFTKGGILWNCHANGLILHSRKAAASLPPPGPAPCLPGSEPVAPRVLGPPGSRAGRGLQVVVGACPRERARDQTSGPVPKRGALCVSHVGAVMSDSVAGATSLAGNLWKQACQ